MVHPNLRAELDRQRAESTRIRAWLAEILQRRSDLEKIALVASEDVVLPLLAELQDEVTRLEQTIENLENSRIKLVSALDAAASGVIQ